MRPGQMRPTTGQSDEIHFHIRYYDEHAQLATSREQHDSPGASRFIIIGRRNTDKNYLINTRGAFTENGALGANVFGGPSEL